jgi:hypothetical protein
VKDAALVQPNLWNTEEADSTPGPDGNQENSRLGLNKTADGVGLYKTKPL